MKGDVFDREKHIFLNILEYITKIAWEFILIDELAIEIAWEALNLFGLYITLRIIKQILLIAEYMPHDVKTSMIGLVEEIVVQETKRVGNLFQEGKPQLWQTLRLYQVLIAEVNVLMSLRIDSKNHGLKKNNFFMDSGRKSSHPSVFYLIEVLPHSHCC